MEKATSLLQLPDSSLLEKNVDAVQYYIKNTFTETRREISESLFSFKDGLSDTMHKTGSYINNLVLPVNNFLKDLTQIEKEFAEENTRNEVFCICLDGQMVPAEEVLNLPMEENY
jgi:hypothetical protein